MAVAYCSSCGAHLDAAGRCEHGCTASRSYVAAGDAGYARGTPSALDAFAAPDPVLRGDAAAPGALTRFSGMWNWGAFLLCPFWLMNHGGLALGIGYLVLSLIPILNIGALGMAIYFGIKGNDWAIRHRRFADEAQFVAVQNAWRNWGIALALIGIVISVVLEFLLISTGALLHAHRPYGTY